jgi:DNA-3-methyladenine glycosylase I
VARFTARDTRRLLRDPGIVRNRAKIRATIDNARAVLGVQREHGSFDRYLWEFVGGRPVQNRWRRHRQVPALTPTSQAMSRALRDRGFRFVGPTICYAFMQAAGLVNDHTVDCFRRSVLGRARRRPG